LYDEYIDNRTVHFKPDTGAVVKGNPLGCAAWVGVGSDVTVATTAAAAVAAGVKNTDRRDTSSTVVDTLL